MNLRKKTLFILSLMTLILVIILSTLSLLVLLNKFIEVENNHVVKSVEQVRNTLQRELTDLSNVVYGFSMWDDTYSFIEDQNEQYINDNINLDNFSPLNVNVVIFINDQDKLVYGEAFDLSNETETTIPYDLQQRIKKSDVLLNNDGKSGTSGIIMVSEGALIVATQPILTSSGEGPSHGLVLMGRYLNQTEVDKLKAITGQNLSFAEYNTTDLSHNYQKAINNFQKSDIYISPLTNEVLFAYTQINDLYGNPALILRIEFERDIYSQGRQSILYFILSIVIAGFIYGFALIYIQDKLVMFRFEELRTKVKEIGTSGDIRKRIPLTQKDEISDLALEINKMLDAIQKAQDELRQTYNKLQNQKQELSKKNEEIAEREKKLRDLKQKFSELNANLESSQLKK